MPLTADAEARASSLHRETLVIDTLGPLGPSTFSSDALRVLDDLVARKASASEAIVAVWDMTIRALAQGELPEFWDDWEKTGVDSVSLTIGAFGDTPFTYENAIHDLGLLTHLFDSRSDRLVKVRTTRDLDRAKSHGKKGVILNFQNTTHIGDDLDKLDLFYELGLRIIMLTYNSRNLVGDGCTERVQAGLSSFGVEVVKRLNELRILVDLSHCGEPTTLDAIEVSEHPVAITHAFCRAISDHDRGKSDDVIRAIGDSGGYFGVCVVPFFITIDPAPTLDHWLAHVDRAVELAGAEHVGVGTDWGEDLPKQLIDLLNEEMRRFGFREEHRVDWAATVDGYRSWREWPNLTRALVDHGYSDEEIRGFLGENFKRVLADVID